MDHYKIDDILIQKFKKIKDLRATPHGKHMFLIGKNGTGKTSFLQAILAVLSGKDLPPEMVTQGEREGEISLTITDENRNTSYACKLTFGNKKKLEIKPLGADGKPGKAITSPRDFLDELIGKIEKTHTIAFDPFEFLKMSVDKRLKAIKDLCGINWDKQDKEYKEVYERRTKIGNDIEAIEGFIAKSDIQEHEYKLFAEPKPIDIIKQEIAGVEIRNKRVNNVLTKKATIAGDIERGEKAEKEKQLAIKVFNTFIERTAFVYEQCKKDIGSMREHEFAQLLPDAVENMLIAVEKIITEHEKLVSLREENTQQLGKIQDALKILRKKQDKADKILKDYPLKTSTELNARLEQAMNFNAKVDKVKGLKAQQVEVEDKRLQRKQMTQQLDDIKREKLQMLPEKMPATGMSIDVENDQLLLDGLPFEDTQINTSRIMRAGFDMLMSMEPSIRIFCVRDASLLDDDSLQQTIDYANELGFQGFFEVVDRKQPVLSYEIHELCEEYIEERDKPSE